MEIGLNLGVCRAPNSMVSVTSRIDGRGGKMYSFWARYSFKISFWRVPDSRFQSTFCCSATTRYIAHKTAAGELMVMETLTSPSGILENKTSMSSREEMATPHLPTSPSLIG